VLDGIGGASLLLGRTEIVGSYGQNRPVNTPGWVDMDDSDGGRNGNVEALTRRIARARKLPAVLVNPALANALRLHAEAFAAVAAPPPFYDRLGPPLDGGFLTVSTSPDIDPVKYTLMGAAEKLLALIEEGKVWMGLRQFEDSTT
jgi:hypothetical protein